MYIGFPNREVHYGSEQQKIQPEPLSHLFARSFAPHSHFRAQGKVNDEMLGLQAVLNHSELDKE